ncbi:M56 family metallopeptidase [Paenibacillus eucommiae]|uniref:Beta-lactamase regulating signal transducer with metallopeptidase domain n=1 Tax=Paenibacillus eucommiae TaxID=1355755 RepID=A0ABS4IP71_9BACL|nr:M56 family metallopeptidase [Paenibacillus eucommiae]MBP1989361.1 beta-lactamase regulating signal transducer with metallopeptidase domain [Paenibacillus eucommiae]
MSMLFTTVLNMSITASYIALGVLLIRLLIRRLPKIFSYVLWSAVLIRLVCPVSFTSDISFLNFIKPKVHGDTGIIEYLPYNIGLMQIPSIETGITSINQVVNNLLPAATPTASANPMQVYMSLISSVWILGIVVLLGYSVISYLKVIRKIRTATLVRDNIFETDRIDTPFVFGLIRPKIYVPVNLSANEWPYILAHEQTHIQRWDYLVKPFSFLVLIVHWFNPIMWLSFVLMSKDMEMSCDENVIKKMGMDSKGGYSNSLLSISVKRSGLHMGSPLAFGESHIKSRITNILSYRKPAVWAAALTIVATVSLLTAFTANPKSQIDLPAKSSYSGYGIEALIDNQTPYVGNNSKVVALIDAMPLPVGIKRGTVELQTANPPFGITIQLMMSDASELTAVSGAISGDAFNRNSILLFSLIDNVENISYKIIDNTGNFDGASYNFTFNREQADKWAGSDVRHYADNIESLKNLIDRLNGVLN